MTRFALTIVLIAAVAVACAVPTQHPKTIVAPTLTLHASDSVSFKPSPELQKSMDELAASVQAFALRIANDPQLRAAAMQVASGFVATAQQAVTEQSVVIQEALKTAAERLAKVQAAQQRAKRP
ncbi:MAG: hypothetical protein ABR585_04545 [Gemmatimonadaceae bacterium]